MIRVLIVEDEKNVLSILSDFLISEGYEVVSAKDGISGKCAALTEKPNIILLDIMLPKKSGYDVCKELRAEGVNIPIIMLTAKGQEIDKVLGLELGADDYITKPFGLMELNSRIRALLRRVDRYSAESGPELDYYEFDKVEINLKGNQIVNHGQIYELSTLEAGLMRYFIQHVGECVSREQIFNEVWKYNSVPNTRTLDVHICNLRKKIESDPKNPCYLLTIQGTGYKFTGKDRFIK